MLDVRVKEAVENEWLGLGDTSKIEVANPFSFRTQEDIQQPDHFMLKLMRDPKYFGFTCKWLLNKDLPPYQLAILREMWIRPFPMLIGSRGLGKSFMEGLYAVLRATLCPGSKIVIVGAAFRQAKFVFEYCESIWNDAPVLRDLAGDARKNGPRRDVDRCTLRIGDSIITALPLGDGQKIRGQRASIIIADEFASIPVDIYENVVAGFAAVSASPIEKLRQLSRIKALKAKGLWSDERQADAGVGFLANQSIISGTAYYGFNAFCDYWKRWKSIVESRGDRKKLEEIFKGEVPERFNWKDYSVLRIPVDMLPEGFMDERHVAKAKATVHASIYQMEYGAVFALDSDGFFKRSLIESCVVGKPANPISLPSSGDVNFAAVLRGNPKARHVMAIDPASERDNFCVVVLECWADHRRIVHCWTTTRKRHGAKLKKGLAKQQDFYGYCARKIRDLLRMFPCERIALDSQGGGVAVLEALHDPDKMDPGEVQIWPVVDPQKPADSDGKPGLHVIELVQFASADWVEGANHGMKKDFEDKALLFPRYDAAQVGLAIEEDKLLGRVKIDPNDASVEKLYDTLEDCVMDIEQMKDELASIVHTQTPTGRDKWDTPEVKLAGGKKGRLRKDRYSALLMANMVGRQLQRADVPAQYEVYGGFAHEVAQRKIDGFRKPAHQNPDWYARAAESQVYGAIVNRSADPV